MFKDKIKELRKNNQMTQEELAAKLSISRQSISKWENGLSYPTKSVIHSITEVFDISVTDLLDQEEIMMISIDNNTKIKRFSRRNFILTSGIILVALSLIAVIWMINHRINQLGHNEVEEIIPDPLIGFIVLDTIGSQLINQNDEKTLIDVIESNNYPYEFLNVKANNKYWTHNKLFHVFTSINYNNDKVVQETTATIYIKKSLEHNIYSIYGIYYSLESDAIYLGSGSGYSGNLMGSVTSKLEGDQNDISGALNFHITLSFVDELSSVELYQYDETNSFIAKEDLEPSSIYSLDEETLYFILRETYINVDGETYVHKVVVNFDDFYQNYYYAFKEFKTNNFGNPRTITLNTYK